MIASDSDKAGPRGAIGSHHITFSHMQVDSIANTLLIRKGVRSKYPSLRLKQLEVVSLTLSNPSLLGLPKAALQSLWHSFLSSFTAIHASVTSFLLYWAPLWDTSHFVICLL